MKKHDYMSEPVHGERIWNVHTGLWMEWDSITDGWWEVKPQPKPPQAVKKPKTDPIVDMVVSEFKQRSEVGVKKYGVTLDRDDLSLEQWVQHALEEAMDLTLYLKRIKVELEKVKDDGK